MLQKIFVFLVFVLLLMGCRFEADQLAEDSENAESKAVTSSEIAVPNSEIFEKVEVIGGDEQDLREFIQRWFTPMVISPSLPSEDDDTTITIGELPEDLPFEFPLPEGAVVFASVQSPYDLQVWLDIPMDSADLMAAYTQNLERANWNQLQDEARGGGFESATENWQIFCDDQTQYALALQFLPKSSQESEMRITLHDKDVEYMCDPEVMAREDPGYRMLPLLEVPAGAWVSSENISSGDGFKESTSVIQTDLSPKELSAHFSRQMEATGWSSPDGGDEQSFSWSSWKIQDEQDKTWSGILIILKDPVDADRLFALMRVVIAE